jgi:predicted aldo/keto reductase-like oxidoreductase
VRFIGVSSHTPDLETVMAHAVDSGRFDVIMVAYNFNNWPDLTSILHRAHERGVGVIAMKTLKGARHSQLADFTSTERESFPRVAFKWVLSNGDVSGLVVSMSTYDQLDEYLAASGQPVTTADVDVLEKYDRLVANDYCCPGCGDCLDHCPQGVPADDVLRYQMYAENHGFEKKAMRPYARLDPAHRADQCLDCPAPSENGVRLRPAHPAEAAARAEGAGLGMTRMPRGLTHRAAACLACRTGVVASRNGRPRWVAGVRVRRRSGRPPA